MALLQWTDKFRLGIDVVDREHRELVDRAAPVALEPELLPKRGALEETQQDRKSTRLNSSHPSKSRMPSSA